jgi:hypothetical protein
MIKTGAWHLHELGYFGALDNSKPEQYHES